MYVCTCVRAIISLKGSIPVDEPCRVNRSDFVTGILPPGFEERHISWKNPRYDDMGTAKID